MNLIKKLESKFSLRTTEELKADIIEAKKSTEENSSIVFVAGLNVLHTRLNEKEYEAFEDSL